MNSRKRKEINKFSEQLSEILELTPPIDVYELVKKLDGDIVYAEDADGKEAKIEKCENEDYNFRITLPHNTSPLRDRFTIAHEIGHLFLHMGYLVDEDKWESTPTYKDSAYYRSGHSEEEYEANEFAASLLMPQKEFFEICRKNKKNNIYNITSIADYFETSTDAAKNRGRWLGLFSWE
ncbi:ImmA/IrrE family metallo-endopeptidase [Rummeliibacillus stabekisii]|uniref:IrrE N-terminal-like domain-containing protein n=1 Tax=Rummeliibacillus stabekisii TaxID=241244 RepID=A0A143HF76_9BACL|nr:ImmA/IrrE family metallo-endopeptidase [Rummeliibacillus stabekisii]AMX00398.1 hypothetical protein ATY39_13855 [Rummeliibacillus stabekisii]